LSYSISQIDVPQDLKPKQTLTVALADGRSFDVVVRFDTEVELTYFRHGGILNYMIRKMLD
jgi:aconitate hydratase